MKDETMFAELLQRLNSEGTLTHQDTLHATGMSKTSYYRWVSGESEPTATALSLLIRNTRSAEARVALLAFLTAGTRVIAMEIPEDMDLDGDGDVNLDDALEAAANVARGTAEEISRVIKIKRQGVTGDQAMQFREAAQQTIAKLIASVSIVEHLAAERAKNRKQARPLNLNLSLRASGTSGVGGVA